MVSQHPGEGRETGWEELRRLAEAATPGEWRHGPLFWEGWAESDDGGVRVFEVPHLYPYGASQPGVFVDPAIGRTRETDAAFIVAAVNFVRDRLAAARGEPGLDVEPLPLVSLLRELDACKPLYEANGPVHLGKTFSGWNVPDWLMQRVRVALRGSE